MFLAFIGRAISMIIEIYFCLGYASFVLENDENARRLQEKSK
jgi:hypothetical protein